MMAQRRDDHRSSAESDNNARARAIEFARRHGAAIGAGVGAGAVVLVSVVLFILGDESPPPRRVQEFTIVNVMPPPPPPPPPEPQKQPEPEMIEQPQMVEPEIKEEAKVEEPKEAPPADANDAPPPGPLGPGSDLPVGPGNSNFLPGSGGGGGGGGGSRWGWYATIVQQQIEAALRGHPKTRNVVLQVQVRLWADNTGRVSRVELVKSTGDAEIDAVIRGEVLSGITLRQPPPADMPMPMVARITARRPS